MFPEILEKFAPCFLARHNILWSIAPLHHKKPNSDLKRSANSRIACAGRCEPIRIMIVLGNENRGTAAR